LVEGRAHPIPVRRRIPISVHSVSMCIGKPRNIHPMHGHFLPIMRRINQSVGLFFISIGGRIAKKASISATDGDKHINSRLNLLMSVSLSVSCEGLILSCSNLLITVVNGIFGPCFILYFRKVMFLGRDKSPMLFVSSPIFDPFDQDSLFFRG
jgi:hypothetical protein